jgi:hypothetical protein
MSNINPNNIDGTFPIAGQDNSSQGFRDNFTNIRNNFSYAQSEVSDLQAKALTTSALTGQTLTNDMNYNQIMYAQLMSPSFTFLNLGTPTSGTTITLDYSQANWQKVTTNGTYTVGFANWPVTGQQGEMYFLVNVTNNTHTLTFSTVSPGLTDTVSVNNIAGAYLNLTAASTATFTFDIPGNYLFRFTTTDSGQNIIVTDASRNKATLQDPDLYWNDQNPSVVSPTLLVGYGTNLTEFQTIQTLETGQDAVSAKGSYNSVGVGNLALANVSYQYTDTGPMAGYSLSGARGNLQTATISAVSSGDFLGYLNAITYTGSPTEVNQFQQVASIGFYATGSNVLGGLGGNVGIFTHQPVTTGNLLVQAAGFENDQSTKFFGNVTHSAGFIDQGYQYLVPTTGFWQVISTGKSKLVINPVATLAQGNVTLPNAAVDGTIVSVHSTQTITLFGANSQQSGTTIIPSTGITLSAGTGVEYLYHSATNNWFKIR